MFLNSSAVQVTWSILKHVVEKMVRGGPQIYPLTERQGYWERCGWDCPKDLKVVVEGTKCGEHLPCWGQTLDLSRLGAVVRSIQDFIDLHGKGEAWHRMHRNLDPELKWERKKWQSQASLASAFHLLEAFFAGEIQKKDLRAAGEPGSGNAWLEGLKIGGLWLAVRRPSQVSEFNWAQTPCKSQPGRQGRGLEGLPIFTDTALPGTTVYVLSERDGFAEGVPPFKGCMSASLKAVEELVASSGGCICADFEGNLLGLGGDITVLQLAIGEGLATGSPQIQCFLVDPKCEAAMDAVKRLMKTNSICKCFWAAEKDQEALHQLGIYPKRLADLQKVYGGSRCSMDKAYENLTSSRKVPRQLTGLVPSKSEFQPDWDVKLSKNLPSFGDGMESPVLSRSAMVYSAGDVVRLLIMKHSMQQSLQAADGSDPNSSQWEAKLQKSIEEADERMRELHTAKGLRAVFQEAVQRKNTAWGNSLRYSAKLNQVIRVCKWVKLSEADLGKLRDEISRELHRCEQEFGGTVPDDFTFTGLVIVCTVWDVWFHLCLELPDPPLWAE
ncbi:MEGF10 [Symbiodinium sp. CCMP2592]|nr:MEGF10 [Symbiodinium sp. CCMP2592]